MNQAFDQENSKRVARAISQAVVSAIHADPAGVVRLLEDCRASLLLGQTSEYEKRELARRISEAKVSELFNREGGEREFRASWLEMETAGYTSLEREASMLFYYVKFCERAGLDGRSDLRAALDRMESLVDQMRTSGEENLASEFASLCARLRKANL
jgi:phenylpyruvate tautomerase PptA (4-oxalocrotonate tautomerase family)